MARLARFVLLVGGAAAFVGRSWAPHAAPRRWQSTARPAADGDEAADTAVPDGVVHAQMPDLGTPLNPDVTRARELCERLGGVNVYLVGMMGAGKSSVGDVLAQRFGRYSLVDTDSLIEQLTSASIAEIFESEGEPAFRDLEASVLSQVHSFVRCVVSTGGGIVLRPQNWGKMQTGIVVWLDAPLDVLCARLAKEDETSKRPLLDADGGEDARREKLEGILAERRALYEQADVTVTIDAADDAADVAKALVEQVIGFIDANPPKAQEWKRKADAAAAAARGG